MKAMRRTGAIVGCVLIVLALAFFEVAPDLAERSMNRVLPGAAVAPSAAAIAFHRKLLIADLHADSLLWDRNLLTRSTRGHIDIPRLIEGNVALQVFTAVTKTPRGINIERNDDRTDSITLLMFAQLRPIATWTSLAARALNQAAHLRRFADNSAGRFTIIRSAAGLASYLDHRRADPQITAGLLGIEGAHALDGNLENLGPLYDAGFRLIGLTHFFDNDMAGSAHGIVKGGLTEKGRELVRRMEARRMIVDLAHSSPRTIDDALAMATRPVIISHTGVKGTCNNTRNLSDEQLRGVARTGGVIGIGYWDTAVCGNDAHAIARAIRYAVGVVGAEHVALGSDFDGATTTPFDTSGLVLLTDALLREGFSDDDIAKIMGGNVFRLLAAVLPEN
ncbi:MAG TPA: dipeptidase [Candidatus Acidoferrales bacterium]|nr:dipeptidase [Candidatus Acidoferrales bacterium]